MAHLLLLLGAATAVFITGRVQEASLGVFLLLAGLALIACPPRARVDWWIVALGGALVLCASAALLPQAWFPEPEWRQRLEASAFPPIASVSPAPIETYFWLAVFGVAVGVGLFSMAHPLGSKGLLVLAVTAVLICGLYTGMAIFARRSGWEYPLSFNPGEFGFFANRNHTAMFLVSGCILSLGILGVAFRAGEWSAAALAAACLATGAVALFFFSESRSGIVFLIAGTLVWVAGLGKAHRSKALLVSFAAIFCAGILLFFASPSTVRQRVLVWIGLDRATLAQPPGVEPTSRPTVDGRVHIFRDTLGIVREFPFTGSGLGTFRYVFPFYRERSLWDSPIIHPESDWLMLAAETGIPALILAMAGLGWLVCRAWAARDHPSWPLRWGFLSAALAAVLHGFVDVPAHRAAPGWWILVLLGIGLQGTPRTHVPPSRIQHLLFVLAGIGAISLGFTLVRAEWFGGPPSPPFAGFAAQPEVIGLRLEGKLEQSAECARRAIQTSPMNEQLYFQLGATLLESKAPAIEIEPVLLTQRLLDPNEPQVCIEQGFLWIDTAPVKTASLWLEAVQRRERIDTARGGGRARALSLFRDLIGQASSNTEVQRRLLAASAGGSDFTLTWLEAAAVPLVSAEAARLAADPAFLAGLDDAAGRRFLKAWYGRGDRQALFQFIEAQPEWSGAAWTVFVLRDVDAGRFADAVRRVSERFGIRLDLPASDGPPLKDPPESADPAVAFASYWARGNLVTARRVLEEARARASRNPEIWRLSAAVAIHDSQWQPAWSHLERYLKESGLESSR